MIAISEWRLIKLEYSNELRRTLRLLLGWLMHAAEPLINYNYEH